MMVKSARRRGPASGLLVLVFFFAAAALPNSIADGTAAFVAVPRSPLLHRSPTPPSPAAVVSRLQALPHDALPPFVGHLADTAASTLGHLPGLLLSDEAASSAGVIVEEGLGGSIITETATPETFEAMTSSPLDAVFDTVKTVLIALTAIAFGGVGLALLFASVIIPQAAKQLEEETRELAPELWDEYQSKLGEGETLAQRPDLLKELGDKVQPLIDAKIAKGYQEQLRENEDVLQTLPAPSEDVLENLKSASVGEKEEEGEVEEGIKK